MTEAIFPLLGAFWVILVVLPSSALLAKMALLWLERDQKNGALHGLNLRYLVLVASSILPLAWFVSAGAHQAESGTSALACLFVHDRTELCFEAGFFVLALLLLAGSLMSNVLRKHRVPKLAVGDEAARLSLRIDNLLKAQPEPFGRENREWRGRVVITSQKGFALATHGFAKPRVLVGISFAETLSDDMLLGALGHEFEHARSRDPLRYLLLNLALAINPFGRFLLAPHVARWYAARELHCDREAVVRGSAPLSLAAAIVRAARPAAFEQVALGARDTNVLKLRIDMLLAFSERAPTRCCHRDPSALPIGLALLALTLLLPHQTGTAALDILHTSAEYATTYFWR